MNFKRYCKGKLDEMCFLYLQKLENQYFKLANYEPDRKIIKPYKVLIIDSFFTSSLTLALLYRTDF